MTPTHRSVYAFFLIAVALFLFLWLMPIMINVESTIISTLGFLTGSLSLFLFGLASFQMYKVIQQSRIQQPKE